MSNLDYSIKGFNDLLNDLNNISVFLNSDCSSCSEQALALLREDQHNLIDDISTYFHILSRNGFRPTMS